MSFDNPLDLSRRAFLRRSAALAGTGAALPLALNLAAFGEAAAFNAVDYKALVCIFLLGGNDHANTVVAYDEPNYARYHRARGGAPGYAAGELALARADLAATLLNPGAPLPDGMAFALHPGMSGLARLFHAGQAAVQLNVGPLIVPTTKQAYLAKAVPLPPKLFSHNDQQSVWQSQSPEGATSGWGGRLGDLALSNNGNALFTCISASGNALFMSGQDALQYQVSVDGAISVKALNASNHFGSVVSSTLRTLMTRQRQDPLELEYNRVSERSFSAESQINAALAGVNLATAFPTDNPLASQLKIIARLIGARTALGVRRQVFFASCGPFDHHDGLMSKHPKLIAQVSAALSAFYNATQELGVSSQVTAFTASDFGRTLTFNNGGSDHGWGGHHFVVGGAVRGNAFYGKAPPMSTGQTDAPEDQWHVGQGRLLPTTAIEQYAATLGRWFGVDEGQLADILPNLRNFGTGAGRPDYPVNLGFLG